MVNVLVTFRRIHCCLCKLGIHSYQMQEVKWPASVISLLYFHFSIHDMHGILRNNLSYVLYLENLRTFGRLLNSYQLVTGMLY